MRHLDPAITQRLLSILPVLLAALVHFPVLESSFFLDDYYLLFQDADLPFLKFFLDPRGGHMHLTHNLVFHFAHLLFGLKEPLYFAFILAVHLLNVYLTFWVILALTKRPHLAVFGAALWGMAPNHHGVLSWFSCFGVAMVSTFFLLVVLGILDSSRSDTSPSYAKAGLWVLLLLAAANSFGVGIAVAGAFGVCAWLLLEDHPKRNRIAGVLSSLLVLLPAVYILVHTQLEALETDAMLASRASSLLENAPEIAPFLLGMISFGLTSLLFGPLLINSSGYVDVLRVEPTFHFAYGAGLILLVALVGSLIAANRRDRRRLLFFSTITIACYALVAAFRVQVLETFSFETLAMTPRYHYTAQLAGTITLCLAISQIPIRAGLRRWLLPIWLVLCIGPYVAVTQEPIAHPKREAARHEFAIVADYFENVIRAQPDGAELRLPNRKFRNLPMSAALFPNWAGLFIILFPENVVDGKTIRFVERNPTLLEFWKRNPNSRIADLLVAP